MAHAEAHDPAEQTRVADALKNTLADLAAVVRTGTSRKPVEPLHERIREQLGQARKLADKDEERKLVAELERCLDRYFVLWQHRATETPEERAATVAACRRDLEAFETRKVERELA